MVIVLQECYQSEVVLALIECFGYGNVMQVLEFEKIVVNIGCGDVVQESKVLDVVIGDFMVVIGQKLVVRWFKKVILNFKLCQGVLVGCMVTMRGIRMFEFFDCLINFVLLQICDFRGVFGCSFDGCGNYNMGLKDQIIFFEIDYDKIDQMWGMDIVIVILANLDGEVRELFVLFGMFFGNQCIIQREIRCLRSV